MKTNYIKSFLLLVTLLIASASFSQAVYNERYPKMRFGFNMGGIWQTNDLVKNKAGFAGGVTLEKVLNKKDDAILGFSFGFRYLGGYSSGYDNRKDSALKLNTALNTADSTTNYFKSPGYFYNNYRTNHNEGAFELKMNFPKFEKRTNLVFHVYGGIGAAKYNTKINALDHTSKYDYSGFGNTQPSLAEVQRMYDFTYETPADGNSGNGNIVIAPSCGFGFGVRFSKNFSLVFEHRLTFPRVDVLDGKQWKDNTSTTGKNDYYNYTSAHMIFTIYGGGRGNISTNTNNTSNNTINNNTNNATNTTSNNNNTPKPIINIYTPINNPSTSATNIQQVSGTVKYVTSSSGISVVVNGVTLPNFDFNSNNGALSFNTNLRPGVNNVTITATNSAGQDSETLEINYSAPQITSPPVIAELPPKVVITYPSNNYVSTLPSVNVNAVLNNISSSSNIAVSVNGNAISNFNYNSFTGALNFTAPLNNGNNSIVVSAFNSAGNDAQQVFVKYIPTSNVQINTPKGEPKPVVSFHNPSSSPYESAVKQFGVTAHVTNVTAANQISVVFNGIAISNFTFNSYGFVNFNVDLNVGSNSIVITGTNTAGSDVKTATINYKESGIAPVVTILEPSQTPFVTESISLSFVAKVENVQNQSNINVLLNNTVVPFSYNTVNRTVSFQANLNPGKNVVLVSAVNNFGSDSKTQVIERTLKMVKKPLVTIITPSVNPFASFVSSQQVVAQVFNVSSASEIQVRGQANLAIPFTYDATTQQISFSVNLVTGANVYSIVATNTGGTDSKSLTINYTPKSTPILVKPPVITLVNPAINPFSTFDAAINVIATALNVSSQQELSVKLNGASVNFTFNAATKEILVPSTLVMGNNTLIITASNMGGSDSKTQIIERKEMTRCFLSPVVNIITPQPSPYNTSNASENVRAEVLNVNASSNIQVLNQSGQSVAFTYDNVSHFVNFTANLLNGSNVFTVKATNNIDVISQSVTIVYTKIIEATQVPVKINKPLVTFVVPSQINTTIQVPSQIINASVSNVTAASGIVVQVNGQAFSAFTFTNGVVTFTLTCAEGNNTISISGTNAAGTDTKSVFVNYEKPAPPMPLPVVSFVTPATLSTITSNATQNIQASILNITNASQAQVQVNGTSVTNFTYANGSVSFVANLIAGNNSVQVKGTNTSGSDTKTISIIREKPEVPVVILPPVLNYLIPSGSSLTTANSSENIRMTVVNVNLVSQISVKVNGSSITNFTLNHSVIDFNASLSLGANTIMVNATNSGGSDSKQILVNYELPRIPAPVVTIITPASVSNVSVPNQNVEASITNVTSASQVQITVNGNPITSFNFTNGNVSFVTSLDPGVSVISVKGTNASGSDTKSVSVTFTKLKSTAYLIPPPVVTFVNPNSQITTVSTSSSPISATITNVNQSQVIVKVNGTQVNNFSFSNSTVNFISQLNLGINTIEITGTNESGTNSKSVQINYVPPAPIVNPPVVNILAPNNNLVTLNNVENVTAKITEVSSASQVSILLNNSPVSIFNFSNGDVNFVAALSNGTNTIKITGTNSSGSDTKTLIINRQSPPAPQVTITNPASNPYSSTVSNVSIDALVINVSSAAEISVATSTGTIIPFTYDAATNLLSFNYVLNGNTTFIVTASNVNGSDSKSVTVNYNLPIALVNAPVVTFITPGSSNTNTANALQNVSATVTRVSTASQIEVALNNAPITNFTFANGTVNFVANLSVGVNEIKIRASNSRGSDEKMVTVTRQAPPSSPLVTVTSPTTNPFNSLTENINVVATVENVSNSSEINVTADGVVIPFNYNTADNILRFSYTLTGNTSFVISASNSNGSDSKTLVVNYKVTIADPEITICHKPPGNPTNTQQLTIPQSAWPAHQAHGDELGACPPAVTTPTVGTTPDPEIVICHKPPGNPTNTQQLTIPQSAWPAHQAHGDELGACPPSKGNNGNNDNKSGTLLNGIKGILTSPTTTTTPTNTVPKKNNETNTQPSNTMPKTGTEPKKEEPKVIPKTVQPTTNTVTPSTTPVKTAPTSTVTESTNGGSVPRVIKPR